MKIGGFKPKVLRLIEEYIECPNVEKIYLKAGYKTVGTAKDVLKQPEIKAEIERRFAERIERSKMSADDVLLELAKIAKTNTSDVINDDGSIKPPSEWPEWAHAAVAEYNVTESLDHKGRPRVKRHMKLHDKLSALQQLARHLGLFNDKLTINAQQTLAVMPMEKLMEQAKEAMQLLTAEKQTVDMQLEEVPEMALLPGSIDAEE